MIDCKDWNWIGTPGHFCLAHKCSFTLNTNVGRYKISSVGALYDDQGKLAQIGWGIHYETLVFPIDENGQVTSWTEIDQEHIQVRKLNPSSEYMEKIDRQAAKMHFDMCLKYAEIQ